MDGYEIRSRSDRDTHEGGLIEFTQTSFICKIILEYTFDNVECTSSEFTISKKKWICVNIYRPPVSSNLTQATFSKTQPIF